VNYSAEQPAAIALGTLELTAPIALVTLAAHPSIASPLSLPICIQMMTTKSTHWGLAKASSPSQRVITRPLFSESLWLSECAKLANLIRNPPWSRCAAGRIPSALVPECRRGNLPAPPCGLRSGARARAQAAWQTLPTTYSTDFLRVNGSAGKQARAQPPTSRAWRCCTPHIPADDTRIAKTEGRKGTDYI
jgi:hypothetical protein